jgi:hypothetical protein
MKFLTEIKSLIGQLTSLGIALVLLGIAAAVLAGDSVPFFGNIAGNVIALTRLLGDGGLVGLIVAGVVIWLLSFGLAGQSSASGSGAKDNLQKISGVGPAIERKLNAMGYARFEQIAGWNRAEIDEVDDRLNFKGRIAREGWVRQAKILAAGGETEFSRRVK